MRKALWILGCLALVTGWSLLAQEGPGGGGGRGGRGGGRGGRGGGGGGGPNRMQEMMTAAWGEVDKDACFKALDANEDGNVTKEEFDAADLGKVFGDALREAMRKVREEQGGAAGAPGANRSMVERLDKDGDGKISAEEFPRGKEAFDRLLQRADKNGDGMLTDEELNAARAQGGGRGNREE